ncbi:MAG: HEPN domain-containing protein [Lachnospiraceae bacterium]|nr:HEPN domain-containing protein [Lachnospiraceae bacterium]
MENSMIELSKYRFESSKEDLFDAKLMYENGRYKNALNRGYYAIFHAIRAVNALDGFDSSKHSGVIAHFNQEYVKTGIFSKEISKIIKEASENREKADYLDFFVASKEEAQKQLVRAEKAIELVEQYLSNRNII